jgi:hypothetical protein
LPGERIGFRPVAPKNATNFQKYIMLFILKVKLAKNFLLATFSATFDKKFCQISAIISPATSFFIRQHLSFLAELSAS